MFTPETIYFRYSFLNGFYSHLIKDLKFFLWRMIMITVLRPVQKKRYLEWPEKNKFNDFPKIWKLQRLTAVQKFVSLDMRKRRAVNSTQFWRRNIALTAILKNVPCGYEKALLLAKRTSRSCGLVSVMRHSPLSGHHLASRVRLGTFSFFLSTAWTISSPEQSPGHDLFY